MNPDEREMRSGSDHFENTGLMSMEVKVSLFPQQKSQDERACLYLQGWCWISAPKAKKIICLLVMIEMTLWQANLG